MTCISETPCTDEDYLESLRNPDAIVPQQEAMTASQPAPAADAVVTTALSGNPAGNRFFCGESYQKAKDNCLQSKVRKRRVDFERKNDMVVSCVILRDTSVFAHIL